ncbi:MAG: flagellar basal body L-ring protein FlgH [Gammaproteobacteria bacterium]|nr:flagellar basal body L-ring protein FlgH [Gammaproteobacteria bacterium]
MRNIKILNIIFISVMLSMLNACVTVPQELADFKPIVRPVAPPEPVYEDGSLYQLSSVSLFEDPKPFRVGDILTILLEESTSASKSAATSTSKDENIDFGSPTIMGLTPTFKGNELLDINMNPSREFDGEGDSTQSNSLSGEITVTVVDILPNGNLVVQGEKWFTLNQGKEYIRIAGVVRPRDVQPDNTIASAKLADAQIAYSGEGFIADSNNQGWLARFFSSKWWPF